VRAFGFTRQPPCAAPLPTVFRRLARAMLAAKLGAWAETRLRSLPISAGGEDAVALDGKPLRGRQKQGAPGAPLLSALTPRLGLPLAQQAVADRTNEMPVALALLHQGGPGGPRGHPGGGADPTRHGPTDRGRGRRLCAGRQSQPAPGTGRHYARLCPPAPRRRDPQGGRSRWTLGRAAWSNGGCPPVTCWWAPVTGQGGAGGAARPAGHQEKNGRAPRSTGGRSHQSPAGAR
jgi:hypothetical protein